MNTHAPNLATQIPGPRFYSARATTKPHSGRSRVPSTLALQPIYQPVLVPAAIPAFWCSELDFPSPSTVSLSFSTPTSRSHTNVYSRIQNPIDHRTSFETYRSGIESMLSDVQNRKNAAMAEQRREVVGLETLQNAKEALEMQLSDNKEDPSDEDRVDGKGLTPFRAPTMPSKSPTPPIRSPRCREGLISVASISTEAATEAIEPSFVKEYFDEKHDPLKLRRMKAFVVQPGTRNLPPANASKPRDVTGLPLGPSAFRNPDLPSPAFHTNGVASSAKSSPWYQNALPGSSKGPCTRSSLKRERALVLPSDQSPSRNPNLGGSFEGDTKRPLKRVRAGVLVQGPALETAGRRMERPSSSRLGRSHVAVDPIAAPTTFKRSQRHTKSTARAMDIAHPSESVDTPPSLPPSRSLARRDHCTTEISSSLRLPRSPGSTLLPHEPGEASGLRRSARLREKAANIATSILVTTNPINKRLRSANTRTATATAGRNKDIQSVRSRGAVAKKK